MNGRIRIGIDLGGTKIEVRALERDGRELGRHRAATPRHDYEGSIRVMADLVARLERETGRSGTVGVAIPGSISAITGLVKNANSTWLNGKPLDRDLALALGREVRCVNDANCLAVSEATDGAAAGATVVYLGVVNQPFLRGVGALKEPLFATPPSVPVYHLMRLYNRRFVQMARERRRRGRLGRSNAGHRFMFGGYTFQRSSFRHVLMAMAGWAALECREGWRTWLPRAESRNRTSPMIASVQTAAQQ